MPRGRAILERPAHSPAEPTTSTQAAFEPKHDVDVLGRDRKRRVDSAGVRMHQGIAGIPSRTGTEDRAAVMAKLWRMLGELH